MRAAFHDVLLADGQDGQPSELLAYRNGMPECTLPGRGTWPGYLAHPLPRDPERVAHGLQGRAGLGAHRPDLLVPLRLNTA